MGFFKFRKQHSQTSSDIKKQPVIQRPSNIETPIVPPIQQEIPKPFIPTPKKKKEKEDIGDFFTINIHDIFKHNPKPIGERKGNNGKPVNVFELKFPELELDTFFKVNILQNEDQRYDLEFISNINEIRDNMKEFIDFARKTFGLDFMNKGAVNENDSRDTALGVFSRIWYNNARIENKTFTITLTLYNITPSK